MIEKTYNVGIYCRLSNDDERDGESVSIENQKLLLQSYVRQRGWNEIAVYCDDGYSGTNFDRPGVKRLIEDAKAKKINLILVKDLSRFGRNYIEFGQYTDYLFPSLGCRFIALNNGIDTMSDNGSTDVMCFLNLFNEFYSRDTSKKVKAVKRACAESGKFMGTYPAYGYKRDPEDKHHLVIDEETAPTVRRIFAMRAAGTGFRAIAVTLNEEGVLPPGALYYQRKGRSDPRNVNHKWAETTVKALIRSEVYIGNMVQGKTGTLSYKSRKLINKPEEEWIRVEGTHEPIISREVWDTVVSIDKKKVRKTPPTDGIRSIFTGLVYCADCGFKMRNHIERFTYKDGTPGRYSSFICGNYARSGKSACTIHSIYENVLEELVLTDIREKARFVECDGERLAEQISRMKEKESRSRVISYEQELKAAAARMIELERLMQNLYEDKCTGTIPQTVFQTLRYHEIINSPSGILLSCLKTVRPPGINAFCVRIKKTKRINKSTVKQGTEFFSFLICKSGVLTIGLWIFQIDLCMCHIHIPTYYHRLCLFQLLQILSEIILPLHTIVQPCKFTLGIWCIHSDQIILRKF